MCRMIIVLLNLILVFILVHPVAYAQQRGLLPQDTYKEVGVSQVTIAPEGNLIAFTVTKFDQEKNTRHREIWLQRLRGGRPEGESFRFTAPTEDSFDARWSPDGALLNFQSRREQDPNSIWFTRVTAPGGEAYHISGVDAVPVWSPDGNWIAFTRSPKEAQLDETQNGSLRRGWVSPDAITNTMDSNRFDGRVITFMNYKRDGILDLQPHPSIRKPMQLFVIPSTGGEPRQLTELAFDVREIEWSPDNSFIFFTGDEQLNDEYNRNQTSDIYVIPRTGGDINRLTTNPGSEYSMKVSPDGRRLAFLYTPADGEQIDLKVVNIGSDGQFGGIAQNLTPDWDLIPGAPFWTADSSGLRFTAAVGGDRHLFELDIRGDLLQQITSGNRRFGSFSISTDGLIMAYTMTDPVRPPEIFVNRADGNLQQRVTSFNENWLSDIDLMPAEKLTWNVSDGTQIEGWIIKPVGYQENKEYPMILKIHGGPHSAYGNTFFRTFHTLSSAGFFVLYSNPRGSIGYGHNFAYAINGKWGEMDSEDLLAGVDAALEQYPNIDPTRIGVSGGSYGGFMTNWLTATTDRFAAAVTSRSIASWENMYGTSDFGNRLENEFGGLPWEQRELYRKLSPISYVERVATPTLIIHSEQDYRTPIGEGEQWFMALKRQRVPVEMIRYPRSSHGLSRTGEPWLLVDRLERIRSWFIHWLIE